MPVIRWSKCPLISKGGNVGTLGTARARGTPPFMDFGPNIVGLSIGGHVTEQLKLLPMLHFSTEAVSPEYTY